jgi:hypothetical protein
LLWNRSTLWHQDLKSVAEFLHLYEKRCLAKIRVARFGKGFVMVQALIAALDWLGITIAATSPMPGSEGACYC